MSADSSDTAGQHVSARDLVVSFCFPPFVDTAAIVAAKRVRAAGRPVDVLQNRMTKERRTDPSLDDIAGPLVLRRYAVPSPTTFSSWRGVSSFTEKGVQRALAWDREGEGYERMYSRAQFAASHFLAARFALLRPGLRWSAEFSDPLSRDVTGAVRHAPAQDDRLLARLRQGIIDAGFQPPVGLNAFEWAEHLVFALADSVIFTNAHQRDLMVETVKDRALADRVIGRSVVAPHPTLPPDFYQMAEVDYPLEPGRRHIGYFGNFYATRGMGSVLQAMASLPQAQRARLCLHVFSGNPDELKQEVRERGLQDCVRTGPFLGFLQFLALCRRMDVLLVSDAVTTGLLSTNPFLPSKWSDYLGSGTAVWGMVEPGSVLADQALTYRSLAGHTTSTVQVLAELADDERLRPGSAPAPG